MSASVKNETIVSIVTKIIPNPAVFLRNRQLKYELTNFLLKIGQCDQDQFFLPDRKNFSYPCLIVPIMM